MLLLKHTYSVWEQAIVHAESDDLQNQYSNKIEEI